MADEFKAKGNAAFSAGDYASAVQAFSDGIAADPNNHVLYSNRSAAQASMKNYAAALEDAEKCVSVKADWSKGYSRLGAALHGLGRIDDAISTYEKGLQLDPSNAQLKSALEDVQSAKARPRPGGLFSSPDVLAKLATDPRTRSLLGEPGFMAMFQDVQSNPANMNKYLTNEKFQLLLEVALGLKMSTGAPGGDEGGEEAESRGPERKRPEPERKQAEPEPSPAPEVEMDDGQKEAAARKAEAVKEKEAGNTAYKAREFEKAIGHYNRAWELYDEDISFLTNRAAVYYESGQLELCMEDCERAVERGRELRADYKLVAKALARKGSALVKMNRLEEAIVVFNKSLTEHRNADTLKKLHDAEKSLKEAREQEYINMDLSNVEKDRGNEAFRTAQFPDAVKHYTEALKRGPPAVNPEAHKLYSNLAACYTKLMAFPEGVKAADKCIELCPSFPKGYSRKGALQYFMKEYDKAMETYRTGLQHNPDNAELKEGVDSCLRAISRFATGEASADEIKERQARAMADPEVQNILKDPMMQNVLGELQENPRSAQHHLKHPDIMAKINKLVTAGIVQMR